MPRRITLILVLAVLATLGNSGTRSALALDVPYFATDLPKSAIMQQMVNQPQALRDGDVTYIAYQGPGLDPHIASYNWVTRRWTGPFRAGYNAQTSDTHGTPAIYVDPRGYVHLYFGPHREPLSHVRSAYPNRIDSWIVMPKISRDVTYPQVVRSGGKVLLFYRSASDLWMYRESADGTNWGREIQLTSATYPNSFYFSFREGPNDTVLAAFVRMNWTEYFARTSWGRHDVFFMLRDQRGLWRNAQEDTITVPISQAQAAAQCLVARTGAETANTVVPGVTPAGVPGVMWNQGIGGGLGSYRYRFAHANETSWTITEIARTDHFYDACTWQSEDGALAAYLDVGGSEGVSKTGLDYLDVGGRIHRFTSADGDAWTDTGIIDPGTDGALLGKGLYHNPHLVTGGGAEGSVVFQELCPDTSIEGFAGYLWGADSGLVGRQLRPAVSRVSGADRYATAAAVGKRAFPQGAATVVIASGENFADALVAAPLAKALGAPILLVRHDALPSAALSAIKYLQPKNAVIVGGTPSVSTAVATALRKARVANVARIAGKDRYDTSARVAGRLRALAGQPDTVYIASGERFPDGLSVSAVAAARGEPILLVRDDYVPPVVSATRQSLAPRRTIVVGGQPSVSDLTAASLGATERLAGPNRYDTSAAVAAFGLPGQATYALTRFTATFEGRSGTWTTSSLPGKASFSLNEFGGTDEIQFTSGWGPENHTNQVIENWAPYSINVTLKDPAGTAITSLATTPTAVDLTKWSESEFKIYLNNEASSRIYGTVDLGSSAKAPEIAVKLDGRSLTDGKSTAGFAKTMVGATTKSRKFTIRNSGGADLTGVGVSISGVAKGDFKITKTVKSKLAPDGSTTFEVAFKPRKKGKRNAEIRINSNDADEKSFNIKLKGEGK